MTTDLETFLAKVKDFSSMRASQQNEVLAYYIQAVRNPKANGREPVLVSEIDSLRKHLLLPKHNTAVQFSNGCSKSNGKMPVFIKTKGGYFLARDAFESYKKSLSGRPTAVVVKSGLEKHLAALKDPALKEYLTEAINCFDSQYFRAAIVMGWCAGYAIFRQYLFSRHLTAINTTMSAWKTPKKINVIEDFDELGERVVIDTAKSASAITKEQLKQLVKLLDERNSFAHPSGRKVSPSLAESYLIQIMDEIIKKFS